VELKNDIAIRGTLKSVDQFLNIKLDDIQVVEELKYPHLVGPLQQSTCRQTTITGFLTNFVSSLPSRTSLFEGAWYDMYIYQVQQ